MDADDDEKAFLDAARGAAQLHTDLCAELRDEASVSAAAGWSARAAARAAHTDLVILNFDQLYVILLNLE
jgi:hypothetical protein